MNNGFLYGTVVVVLILLFSGKSEAAITEAQMQDVKVRICEVAGRQGQCKIVLIDDDRPNARAAYNIIEVNDGLLYYVDTVDEFAGVYAHELCHIINGDSERNIPGHTIEKQADECARPLLIKAGYSLDKAARFYDKLTRDNGAEGGPDHPDNPDRARFYRTGKWTK